MSPPLDPSHSGPREPRRETVPSRPVLEVRETPEAHGGVRLSVGGEIDIAVGEELEQRVRSALAAHERVCLDLQAVTFIDSSGIRALLGSLAAARETGRTLEIDRRVAPTVARTFQIAGIEPELWP